MNHAEPARQRQTDPMDPDRARALQATLGEAPTLTDGDVLPPFFHQIYFWDPVPLDGLGGDGHPKTGQGLIPDMGLPRRMWAGGRLVFHRLLRLGIPAMQTATRLSATRKTGRSGALGLVTLRFEIEQAGALCLSEERDLIYREPADPLSDKPRAPDAPSETPNAEDVGFTTTQLFRYSALTFNGHRIHYDRDYAQSAEGYNGLVVHGPLLAQLLMLKAMREMGPLRSFDFRATAPLMDTETAMLCRDDTRLWVRGPEGRLCMEATAQV